MRKRGALGPLGLALLGMAVALLALPIVWPQVTALPESAPGDDGAHTMRLPLILNNHTWVNPYGDIAFVSSYYPRGATIPVESYALHTILRDGTYDRNLTWDWGSAGQPAWSPDGTRLAFSFAPGDPDGPTDLYVMEVRSRMVTPVTESREHTYRRDPTWSPDGASIAFTEQGYLAGQFRTEIVVVRSDGTGSTRLTDSIRSERPAWSPDGRRVAYVSEPHEGQPGLYVMNADGTAPLFVADSFYAYPVWSPDGSHLAYSTDGTGMPPGEVTVSTVVLDGTTGEDLTIVHCPGVRPTWSPDGQELAFDSVSPEGDRDIWIASADGSARRRLTDNGRRNSMPAWSPDGLQIVYASWRDGRYDLYVINVGGTGEVDLTNSPTASEKEPVWRPQSGTPGGAPPAH